MFLQKRNVLVEKLLLQILGAGGDHHAFAGKQRGDQVRERFAGAGARVHQQMLFFGQRGFDGLGHFELARRETRSAGAISRARRSAKKIAAP